MLEFGVGEGGKAIGGVSHVDLVTIRAKGKGKVLDRALIVNNERSAKLQEWQDGVVQATFQGDRRNAEIGEDGRDLGKAEALRRVHTLHSPIAGKKEGFVYSQVRVRGWGRVCGTSLGVVPGGKGRGTCGEP